jgi:hypothetical protein
MAEASEAVLGGFKLRTDAEIVRWPDRYMDKRGREFWERVMATLPDSAERVAHQDPCDFAEGGERFCGGG